MIKVLFICHGNICRSPMAEFVLKDMVKKARCSNQFIINSAATSTEEIGNDIHYGTRKILQQHNIAFSRRSARQITKADYEYYDYLIGMDAANIRNMNRMLGGDSDRKIHKLLAFAGKDKDVADPWYTGDFETTYADVIEGCASFLDFIKQDQETFLN